MREPLQSSDWPKVARYRGTGDVESAASFVRE
jgi:hypothetical protein